MAIIKKDKNRALGTLPFQIGDRESSSISPRDEALLMAAPERANSANVARPKSTMSQSVVNAPPQAPSGGGIKGAVQQAGRDMTALGGAVASVASPVINAVKNWAGDAVSGARAIWDPQAERARYEAERAAPRPGLGSLADELKGGGVVAPRAAAPTPQSFQPEKVGGINADEGPVAGISSPMVAAPGLGSPQAMVGGATAIRGGVMRQLSPEQVAAMGADPTGGMTSDMRRASMPARPEVSAGGGRLIATYRPEDMPASRPQPIAAIADPWAKGNALIEREKGPQGGLGGPRFNKMPSREERLAGIQAGLTREGMSAQSKMASDAQAAQERMLGVKTKSDEVVAGLGIQSATTNKAADRAQELEKARIQAGGRYETNENGNQVYVPGKVSGPAANKYNTMAPDDVRAAVVALTELEQSPIVGTGFGGRITADDKANRQAQIEAAKAGLAAVGYDPQGKTAQSAGSQPKKVNSQAEYDALPAGSPYIDSTGALKHKGRKAA